MTTTKQHLNALGISHTIITVADQLRRHGFATVDDETWAAIQQLDGFADGPAYAREALLAD